MTNIIGGHEAGLLDSSLALLNRNDRSRNGTMGSGEESFVNVSNGNLVLRHRDVFMPSRGEDFSIVRTYNSRAASSDAHQHDDAGWMVSSGVYLNRLNDATGEHFNVTYGDGSIFDFRYDANRGLWVSVEGAGAFETIRDLNVSDPTIPAYILTRADGTQLSFDKLGHLLSSVDTNGVRMDYEYASDRLQRIRDDQGHVIDFIYTDGHLEKILDESGAVLVQYKYASGKLVEVIDRMGHSTKYSYNSFGVIERVDLPSQQVVDGQAESYVQRSLRFEYQPFNWNGPASGKEYLLTKLTDAEGGVTSFQYDMQFTTPATTKPSKFKNPSPQPAEPRVFLGGVTRTVDALGNSRAYSNDEISRQWRVANGYYEYYDAQQASSNAVYKLQVDAICAKHTTTYVINKYGNISEVTDQEGYKTTYTYDEQENLTSVTDRNGHGAVNSDSGYYRQLRAEFGLVDAAGLGKLVADLTPAEKTALLNAFTTRFTYDNRGNLLSRTDNTGNTATFTYTSSNKVATATTAEGTALISSDEAQFQQKRVELGYAALVADLSAADKAALFELYTTRYEYDAKQNLIQRTDAGGDITRFEYDAYGNLTKRIVYLDKNDLGNPAKQQVTQYFYDFFGNNIETVDGEGKHTYRQYDHFGNLVRSIDGNGGVTTYTYDADDRLLSATDPEGHTTYNTYDSVGNRISFRDANGHLTIYTYDRNNMLLSTIDNADFGANRDRVTQYSYDVVGNQTSITDAEGRKTSYVYNNRRQMVEIISAAVADEYGVNRRYSSTFSYDGEGNRVRMTDNRGHATDYLYNRDGLLIQQVDASGHTTRYTYDANRNQIMIVAGMQLPVAKRRVIRFAFDQEDQVVAQIDAEGHTTRTRYTATGARASITDANGNTTNFEYDRNNRLVKEIRPAVTDPATGQSVRYTVQHQYDANGNEVARTDENGHTTRFAFDRDNKLVMVTDGNGIKTVYGYDSRHNSTSIAIGVQAHLDADRHVVIDSAVDSQVTTFTYDEFNQLVAKTDGVGNALADNDGAQYQAMRQKMGYAAAVADLSDADKNALRNAYTDRYTFDRVGNSTSVTDHLGNKTAFQYDSLNRLVKQTDALNNSTTFGYDGNGNRVWQRDALGRLIRQAYDAVNRLTSVTDPLGVATVRKYDAFSNLIEQTRAAGTADARTSRFEYDLNNRLVRSLDPEGHQVSYEYDAVGNRLKVVDARGNPTRYVFDALNRNIKVIDPLSFETRVEYDGVGNRISLIDARGGVTRMQYDAGNRLIQTTDAEGRVTRYEYDVRGNQITLRTAVGTADEEVTRFEYDAQNNLRATVDAEGNRSTNDFDRVYNRVATTDGNGNTTSYSFDALNRLITVTNAEGGQTAYAYDAVGNRLSVTDALGRVTSYAYDDNNRTTTETAADGVVTRYAYDKVANRVAITRADGTASAQTTTFTYDKNDRLLSQADALGNTTRYEYDENGNVIRTINALGHATGYVYDANNRVTDIVDPLGNTTEYRYDAVGNRTQVIDALGNTTTTYYNLNREVVLSVDPEGGATAYSYDNNGNRIAMTRFATEVSGVLDPVQAPVVPASAGDETTRYAYDKLNRLTRTVDAEGYVVDNRYDAVGNVIATVAYANAIDYQAALPLAAQTPSANPAKDRLVQFDYDNVNRLTTKIDAEGYRTDWTYDAVGNQVRQVHYLDLTDLADPSKQQVISSTYDLVNRLVSQVNPLGIETRFEYDLLGNRTARTEAFGTTDARTTRYTYDQANRLIDEINAEGTITRREYDAAGQVIREIAAAGLPEQRVMQYLYDANGRVVSRTQPDLSVIQFAYDAVGNLSQKVDAAGTADQRITQYAYDRNRRVLNETPAAGTSAALSRDYQYDAFGNRIRQTVAEGTADARVMHFAFDRNNRLIAQTDGNGITTLYDYDAFGNQVRTSVTGTTYTAAGTAITRTQTTSLDYDGRNLVIRQENGEQEVITREYDGAGNLRFETQGEGAAASTREFRYDLGNRLVQRTVDPAGLALTTTYEYDRRGNLVAETDADGYIRTSRFDLMNRAVETTDGEGFSVAFEYDRFGNQVSITTGLYLVASTDPAYSAEKAGRAMPATTRMAYDAMNRMSYQVDGLGVVTKFDYDLRGNRTQRIQAYATLESGKPVDAGNMALFGADMQRVEGYRYDMADRLTDEIQPTGAVVHHSYNAAGEKIAKVLDYGTAASNRNATTRYFYDAGGRLQFEVDPIGVVTQYQYDDFNNVVRTVYGLGLDAAGQPSTAATADMRTIACEYDRAQRKTADVVDPQGLALRTSYVYDGRGNQIGTIDAAGARTDTVYDAANRAVWKRDGEGYVTRTTYDGRGNVIAERAFANAAPALAAGTEPAADAKDRLSTYSFDANSRLVESTDARGVVTRLERDALGNVLAKTENATGLYGSAPRTTINTYNLANLVASQTDAAGLTTTFEYDAVYNLTRKVQHNVWTDANNQTHQQLQVTDFRYDLNNRLTDEISDPAGLNLRKSYGYNALGHRISETDANGATTRTYFDNAGRARYSIDAQGYVKEAAYDAVGNLVRATQYAAALSPAQIAALDSDIMPAVATDAADRTTSFEYDAGNRQTAIHSAAARMQVDGQWHDNYSTTQTRVYDAVGNLLRETDGRGNTTYHYYDKNRREIGLLDAENYLHTYTLDAFGNRVEEKLYLSRQSFAGASDKANLDPRSYAANGEVRVIYNEFNAANLASRTLYPSADLYQGATESNEAIAVVRTFDAFGSILTETVKHGANTATPAYTQYRYDAAGRLLEKTDPRAIELATSDSAHAIALRKELGIFDASGAGKRVADLTTADKAALAECYTTRYRYDAARNLREQVEGDRVTTFEFDLANRPTRVIYPAVDRVEVDAAGNVTTTAGYRPSATIDYDAAGNKLREVKPDGTVVQYRYDSLNRQVAALENNVYIEYGYNFAGENTSIRRYFNTTNSIAEKPQASNADQVILFSYDKLGRLIEETQLGDPSNAADDRIVHHGYDAAGNQVQNIDARGNVGTVIYDGLNRIVASVNPAGGLTKTTYDALGNVVARETGGWSAPAIVGSSVKQSYISNQGIYLEWSTDHPTDGVVYVRRSGTNDAYTVYGARNSFVNDHGVYVEGLAADTAYDYYIESKDAFGYSIVTGVKSFRTGTGIDNAVISDIQKTATGYQATLRFSLPGSPQNLTVAVGNAGADTLTLANEVTLTPMRQADGSYTAVIEFADPAQAQFQIRWSDERGNNVTETEQVQQQQSLTRFDGVVKATLAGSAFDLDVTWNVSDALNASPSQIDIYVDEQGVTRYQVYAGFTLDSQAGQQPIYAEATLVDPARGLFNIRFAGVADGARTLYFRYNRPDGSTVTASSIPVAGLANLDSRYQRLQFDFPDINTSGATLAVRTRRVGTTAWTALPASAVHGMSADILGLTEGDYEYQADLVRGGQVQRTSSGSFALREAGTLSNVADAVTPGDVAYTNDDNLVRFPGLFPLAGSETLRFVITDGQGSATTYPFDSAGFDLTQLSPGSYQMRIVKERTETTTTTTNDANGNPVTTTTTTVVKLADISADVTIAPLTLARAQADTLSGIRKLDSFNVDQNATVTVTSTTTGSSGGADHTYNLFDGNGWKTYSNENGGIWTRYFYDGAGNVTKEVRFKLRDPATGAFIDAVQDPGSVHPDAARLDADYAAAVAAAAAGADTIRVTTRAYDAANNLMTETEHSHAYGAVTNTFSYDRFNNKIRETIAAGIAGQESTTRTSYDNLNRVSAVTVEGFDYVNEAGVEVVNGTATQRFTYDGRGLKSTHVNERGHSERFTYDGNGRLASQWDATGKLRTDYQYDAFGRIVSKDGVDLETGIARGQTYEYDNFDQLVRNTDYGIATSYRYDAGGNLVQKTDALGRSEYFEYDAENHVTAHTNRLGHTTRISYDAYGNKLSETDANGRVTRYTLGAFGQVTQKTVTLGAPVVNLPALPEMGGEFSLFRLIMLRRAQLERAAILAEAAAMPQGTSTESIAYDWLGRQRQVTDSYGKYQVFGYDDGDRLVQINDVALGQVADFGYDARGNRTSELLSRNGSIVRAQTNTYNSRGWLTSARADGGYVAGGSSLNLPLTTSYRFDAAGNRVQVNGHRYSYDGAGRMTSAYDAERGKVVYSITYDGFGNRTSVNEDGTTVSYSYDHANRVVSSSAGEAWNYDTLGNTVYQRTRAGETVSTAYDAENRAVRTVSTGTDGKSTTSANTYDAAGNVMQTRVDGSGFGFTEVTRRDLRYLETSKFLKDTWAKGARGLAGSTSFQYDINGNLTYLDRGRKTGAKQNTVTYFEYDNEGHIIGRADAPTANTDATYFQGSATDPNALPEFDEYGISYFKAALLRRRMFGDAHTGTTHLQSYLYVDGKPVAEGKGDHVLSMKTLSLVGGEAVTDLDGKVTGHKLELTDADIVMRADGSVDREATATNLAKRAYPDYATLGAAAQKRVVAYLQGQLPASDADIKAGAKIEVYGYISLVDGTYVNQSVNGDYSYRQIGADGLPSGVVMGHTVREGDTLQGIAAMYYGSSAYWYLIADANGLTGTEPLAEGRTLIVPNATSVNNVNDAATFKVYNENEIIGSTSPEVQTLKKKKKWYQKLVMIIVVVIAIVAAVFTAGAALGLLGATTGAVGGMLGAIGAAGAAFGAGVAGALGVGLGLSMATVAIAAGIGAVAYAAANIVSQGLMIASGLQERFEWKQVTKAAGGGAISGAASIITFGAGGPTTQAGQAGQTAQKAGEAANAARTVATYKEVAVRVGVELGKQFLQEGKIKVTSWASLVSAAVGAGTFGESLQKYSTVTSAGLHLLEKAARGNGDNAMDWVTLASSAIFDVQNAQPGSAGDAAWLMTDAGKVNWSYVAVKAIGTAIVADRRGSDAALNYLGQGIGEGIANREYRKMGDVAQAWRQQQAQRKAESNFVNLAEAYPNASELDVAAGGTGFASSTAEQKQWMIEAQAKNNPEFAQSISDEMSPLAKLLSLVGIGDRPTEIVKTFSAPEGEKYAVLRGMIDPITRGLRDGVTEEDLYNTARELGVRMAVQGSGITNSVLQSYSNSVSMTKEMQVKNTPALVVNAYNATQGMLFDVLASGVEKAGIDTAAVIGTRLAIIEAMDYNQKLSDMTGEKIYTEVWGHSEGSIIANAAVSGLPSEQRRMIDLRNFGIAAGSVPSDLNSYKGVGNVNDLVVVASGQALSVKGGVQYSRGFVEGNQKNPGSYQYTEANFVVAEEGVPSKGEWNHSWQYYMMDLTTRNALGLAPLSTGLTKFYRNAMWVKGE